MWKLCYYIYIYINNVKTAKKFLAGVLISTCSRHLELIRLQKSSHCYLVRVPIIPARPLHS